MTARSPHLLYLRNGRFYADLRGHGGKQEALVPPGESRATTDREVAQKLLADRLQQLRQQSQQQREGFLLGLSHRATLEAFAAEHLIKKARSQKFTDDWLAMHQTMLERAVVFFGSTRTLDSIQVNDVEAWAAELQATPIPSRRKAVDPKNPPPLRYPSTGTIRHYLNALSNLYRRAIAEKVVPLGHNPVAGMLDKPMGKPHEAAWLEVPDAALLLEAARTLPKLATGGKQTSYGYALLATFLLTGGRESEVLGLEVADVSFERQTVTFRLNQWRRLKTRGSVRVMPLWPQLAEILREYLNRRTLEEVEGQRVPSPLLFPGETGGLITDIRKYLDRVGRRGGWKKGEIRSKMFRHTYTSARLQTLDRGAPIGLETVSRELGHGSRKMVEQVYGHLGQIRHRSEVVEFRVEQWREQLCDRMKPLEAKETAAL